MTVLAIRLAGPMQSWGTRSRFGERDTEREPSKSGVLGLFCAALGRPRDAALSDLIALRMGVRSDRGGVAVYDYQTALAVAKASGAKSETLPTRRHYLADAEFLVVFEGPVNTLSLVDRALRSPKYPVALGRRSYVPSKPLVGPESGVSERSLREALLREPLGKPERSARSSDKVQILYEPAAGDPPGVEVRNDVPLSFAFDDRRFAPRTLVREFVPRSEFIQIEVSQ